MAQRRGFQRRVNRQYDRTRANALARSRRQHRAVASSVPEAATCMQEQAKQLLTQPSVISGENPFSDTR